MEKHHGVRNSQQWFVTFWAPYVTLNTTDVGTWKQTRLADEYLRRSLIEILSRRNGNTPPKQLKIRIIRGQVVVAYIDLGTPPMSGGRGPDPTAQTFTPVLVVHCPVPPALAVSIVTALNAPPSPPVARTAIPTNIPLREYHNPDPLLNGNACRRQAANPVVM